MTLYYEDLDFMITEIRRIGWRALPGEVLAFTDAPLTAGDGEAVLSFDVAEEALEEHEVTGRMDLPPGRWWHVPAEVMLALVPKL